ncbi:MAG: hypothetical protein ACHQ52_03940 [Candidatus Eisenbacteria bacterium]
MAAEIRGAAGRPRSARLRAPLLITLWIALGFEAAGGLVIFCARLLSGSSPGVTLHVAVGLVLTLLYAAYQWSHWRRVAPLRARLDYALGLIASSSLAITQASGLALGWIWWRSPAAPVYPASLSALHNIMSMLVLTFVLAHLGAVLTRDSRR